MTGYQWLIVAVITYLNALDGYDLVATAFAAPHLSEEFGIGPATLGWVLSAALIGVGVGAAVLGPLADKFGRRTIVLVSLILDIVGLVMTGFAGSAGTFIFWRLVTGIGVGGVLACVTVVITEFSNLRFRGLATAIYASGYGLGATLCGVLAGRLIPNQGWEWIFFTGAILSAVALLLAYVVLPESVDVLSARGDIDGVRRVAKRIGHGSDVELAPVVRSEKTPYSELVSPAFLATTVRLWIAFALVNFGFSFANSWTPKLLNESGMTAQQGILGGIMIAFGGTIGSLIFGVLTTKVKPRTLLMVFAVLGAAALVAFIYCVDQPGVAFPLGILVGMLLNGCVTGMYTVTPLSYPSRLRATGVGAALAVARAGSVLGPLIIGYLAQAGWGPKSLYVTSACVFVVSAVALAGLKPTETADSAKAAA